MAASNYLLVRQVMQSPQVRRALDVVAARVSAAAGSIAQSEGTDATRPIRTSGTRPRGRPFSRVALGDSASEWGNAKTERRRVLGRAASRGSIR